LADWRRGDFSRNYIAERSGFEVNADILAFIKGPQSRLPDA